MLKIMRQDLIFNRNNLFIILSIMTGFFIYFSYRAEDFSPRAFFLLAALYVGASIGVILVSREDKHKTGALTCSLPVRRSTIVAARFVLTWALMLLTLVYVTVLTAVLPFSRIDLASTVNVKFVLVGLLILSVVFSLMLPFTIRFGVTGVILFLVAGQILGILVLLLANFFGPGRIGLTSPLRSAVRGLRFLLGPESGAVHMLLAAAAIVVLNAGSYIISRALYVRRDL